MKVRDNDLFITPDGKLVSSSGRIDGAKGHFFSFMSGKNIFFCVRKSKVTKKNGWKRTTKKWWI